MSIIKKYLKKDVYIYIYIYIYILLENTPNHLTKFRTKNWPYTNDDACRTYQKDRQIKFKTSMLKSSLCDYSDAHMLVKRLYQLSHKQETTKKVVVENYAPFTDFISEINNTQIDNNKTAIL